MVLMVAVLADNGFVMYFNLLVTNPTFIGCHWNLPTALAYKFAFGLYYLGGVALFVIVIFTIEASKDAVYMFPFLAYLADSEDLPETAFEFGPVLDFAPFDVPVDQFQSFSGREFVPSIAL
jgi:hypothetical protein